MPDSSRGNEQLLGRGADQEKNGTQDTMRLMGYICRSELDRVVFGKASSMLTKCGPCIHIDTQHHYLLLLLGSYMHCPNLARYTCFASRRLRVHAIPIVCPC